MRDFSFNCQRDAEMENLWMSKGQEIPEDVFARNKEAVLVNVVFN